MSARHETTGAYIKEVEANREKLRGPKDGTVCYTNGGEDVARAYVAKERAEGREATTLEQTEYGRRLDQDNLWTTQDTKNKALNDAERVRQKAAGEKNIDPKQSGTKRVWGHTSKTYAEEAQGKVTVVTNNRPVNERGFFAKYERETLIRNEKVTHINGVERKKLEMKLEAVEEAKAKETNALTEIQRAKSEAERKEALRSLNSDIEKGDPTRTKEMQKVAREANQHKKQSAWDRHQKSGTSAPEKSTMRKTK